MWGWGGGGRPPPHTHKLGPAGPAARRYKFIPKMKACEKEGSALSRPCELKGRLNGEGGGGGRRSGQFSQGSSHHAYRQTAVKLFYVGSSPPSVMSNRY